MEQFSHEELSKEIARLEEALKMNEYLKRDYENLGGIVNLEPTLSRIKSLKMQIYALKQYHRWIPVEERLPEEEDASVYGTVLTLDTELKQEEYSYSSIADWNNKFSNKITHWRPLLPYPEEVVCELGERTI